MRKRIYISGKITGLDLKDARDNFYDAAFTLWWNGYNPVNPMRETYFFNRIGKLPWCVYMFFDIILLLQCRGIYMQSNWRESRGARIEYRIAKFLNYESIFEER